ncbi:MAG TPA: HAD hydrolase-like protein [Longimicrobiaceae bacterium]|nr:HAD hydrolase-like protein [Longimicrobiaceae bacterium]
MPGPADASSRDASSRDASMRVVLFDFDGTVVDSRAAVAEALNHVRNRKGLPPVGPERVEGLLAGGGSGQETTDLLVRAGAGGKERRDALMLYGRVLAETSVGGTTVMPGLLDLLDTLERRRVPAALLSTRLALFVEEVLAHTGLAGRFRFVVGADTVMRPPPAPDAVEYVLERSGAAASWLVADDAVLLEAGRRAGVRTAFAAYGFGADPAGEADAVLPHPMRLAELIRMTSE